MKCSLASQLLYALLLWLLVPVFLLGVMWMWLRGLPRHDCAS